MDKVGGWVEDGMDVRSLEAGLDDDGWMEVEEEGEGVGSKGGDEVRKSGGKKKGTDKKGRKWSRDGQYRVAAEDVEEMGGWIEEDDFYD